MSDEQDGAAALAPLAHDREHLLGEVRRQRGRDLVEQQQLRVVRQGAREIEHAQRGQRQSLAISVRSTSAPSLDSRADRVGSARGEARFCATVRSGSSAGSWKTGASPTLRVSSVGEPIFG